MTISDLLNKTYDGIISAIPASILSINDPFGTQKSTLMLIKKDLKRPTITEEEINKHMSLIQTCVALAPLFGLLGTVTGMIEVFQVMAFTGGGDARSMAGGVSKATLPTMAGMTTALSGVFATIYLNAAKNNEEIHLKELIKN